MEQNDIFYNKAEYIETVSIRNYFHNLLKNDGFKFNFLTAWNSKWTHSQNEILYLLTT